MTTAEVQKVESGVRARVRAHIREAEEPDVDAIVESVIEELDIDGMRQALRVSLRNVVLKENAHARATFAKQAIAPTSAKWDAIKANSDQLAVFRFMVFPNGAATFLGDCSREQIAVLADESQERADHHLEWRERWLRLGREMKKKRAQLVSHLPPEKVEEAFHLEEN